MRARTEMRDVKRRVESRNDGVRMLPELRWRIEGGLVVATMIIGAFVWAVVYLTTKLL